MSKHFLSIAGSDWHPIKWSMCRLGFQAQGLRPKQRSGDSSPKGWDPNHSRQWKIWWLVDIKPWNLLSLWSYISQQRQGKGRPSFASNCLQAKEREGIDEAYESSVRDAAAMFYIGTKLSFSISISIPYAAILAGVETVGPINQVDRDLHVKSLLHR